MAVTTQTIEDGPKTAVMKFTWDTGLAETDVVKVDVSALTVHPGTGATCSRVAIERVWYWITPETTVDIIWDATADVIAWSLVDYGYHDFRALGPIWNNSGAGITGDVRFSTLGTPAAGSRYTIILAMRKTY